jgi:8-oxo-dGTP pyrophosphatase MutT (NUDIX family)
VSHDVPRLPASVGALIFDRGGRLLILKTSYKKRWSLPGGQIDDNGESPWDACRRETLEECGLQMADGRLVAVDFLVPRPGRPGGLRYLFDCGTFDEHQLAEIRLQESEIDAYLLAEFDHALAQLSGPLRRRVKRGAGRKKCIYLEEGRKVPGVR